MICAVTEKELVFIFPYPGKKLLEIKRCSLNSIVKTLPYCKVKSIFKFPAKLSTNFVLKMNFPKNCALVLFIVLTVIFSILFITAKQNVVFISVNLNA